ncbi:hypothetical protein GCM10007242_40450 [Pigmentiphaga litoralis]|nr:hypothetical protein GCM10007242_40450 [Pigmentiphaga litoralis]
MRNIPRQGKPDARRRKGTLQGPHAMKTTDTKGQGMAFQCRSCQLGKEAVYDPNAAQACRAARKQL